MIQKEEEKQKEQQGKNQLRGLSINTLKDLTIGQIKEFEHDFSEFQRIEEEFIARRSNQIIKPKPCLPFVEGILWEIDNE